MVDGCGIIHRIGQNLNTLNARGEIALRVRYQLNKRQHNAPRLPIPPIAAPIANLVDNFQENENVYSQSTRRIQLLIMSIIQPYPMYRGYINFFFLR